MTDPRTVTSARAAPGETLRRIGLGLAGVWVLVLVITAVDARVAERDLLEFVKTTMDMSWWYLGAATVAYTAGVHVELRQLRNDPAVRTRPRLAPRPAWPSGSHVALAVIVAAAVGFAVTVMR